MSTSELCTEPRRRASSVQFMVTVLRHDGGPLDCVVPASVQRVLAVHAVLVHHLAPRTVPGARRAAPNTEYTPAVAAATEDTPAVTTAAVHCGGVGGSSPSACATVDTIEVVVTTGALIKKYTYINNFLNFNENLSLRN